MAQAIEQIIARWDRGEGKPYKGRLIDMSAYQGDGTEPPENIGCMCAGWATNEIQGTSIMRDHRGCGGRNRKG
jgi:hypothetical protein